MCVEGEGGRGGRRRRARGGWIESSCFLSTSKKAANLTLPTTPPEPQRPQGRLRAGASPLEAAQPLQRVLECVAHIGGGVAAAARSMEFSSWFSSFPHRHTHTPTATTTVPSPPSDLSLRPPFLACEGVAWWWWGRLARTRISPTQTHHPSLIIMHALRTHAQQCSHAAVLLRLLPDVPHARLRPGEEAAQPRVEAPGKWGGWV